MHKLKSGSDPHYTLLIDARPGGDDQVVRHQAAGADELPVLRGDGCHPAVQHSARHLASGYSTLYVIESKYCPQYMKGSLSV